jgi:Methylamine utilisation protein MauE
MILSLGVGARLMLALVLATSGGAKAVNSRDFVTTLQNLGVPTRGSALLAIAILGTELTVAIVWLIVSDATLVACVTAALLIVFTVAVTLGFRRGVRGSCGCEGVLGANLVGPHLIVRNALLVGIATLALFSRESVTEAMRVPDATALLSVAVASLLLLTVYVCGAIGSLAVLASDLTAKVSQGAAKPAQEGG